MKGRLYCNHYGRRTSKTSYPWQSGPATVSFGDEKRAVDGLQELRRAKNGASPLCTVREEMTALGAVIPAKAGIPSSRMTS
jgi:hypothetical protein